MAYEMRRTRQQLTKEQSERILTEAKTGILAVCEGDQPYAVPLNFVYTDGVIEIHCAKQGHKLDAIRQNPNVSFCVVLQDDVVPEQFATAYRSVVAFGTARIVTDRQQQWEAIQRLTKKYCPNQTHQEIQQEFDRFFCSLCIIRIQVNRITGKQAKMLVRD